MNNQYRVLFIVLTGLIFTGFNGCKKEIPPQQESIIWLLNEDDSIMCRRVDKKDSLIFIYSDSSKNFYKKITAIKTKTENVFLESQAQDPDPSRNNGAKITVQSRKYTFWDSNNKFPIIISVYPSFDQTGTIRLKSYLKLYFNNDFNYLRPIYKNGLPNNFVIYDSLNYNNKVYRFCNYNPIALEQKNGIQILDSTGFPLWLENKVQKINIDFLP